MRPCRPSLFLLEKEKGQALSKKKKLNVYPKENVSLFLLVTYIFFFSLEKRKRKGGKAAVRVRLPVRA
ncbi:MAG: hypothetical protein COT15_02870 [Candidatus Diapherotrites archaeon CG08_land_8_20_14_0_20_34_12]|nr:MAG: hypothetical protein COT15_02870 [Candidatus Diapherotrites archaeon CG08_land_8_20_14_0_20_34_12]